MEKEEKTKAKKKEDKGEKKAKKGSENVKGAIDNSRQVYIKIPSYPFTYVAKDINHNILGKFYVEFQIRILNQKNVEYVVELFPLYSTNLITTFSFITQRTKNNIKKNSKRVFNLNYEGYPGRDGETFFDEVSKVILELFNNPSSEKARSVEVEATATSEVGDSFNDGNATYTIITLPTSTNGTCFLSSVFEESSIVIPSTVSYSGTYTVVSIGNPVDTTTPSYNAFANATSYKSVSIPTSVTNISVSAFYNCSDLTTLIIPSGSLLQNIGPNAFEGAHLSYIGTSDGGYNSFQNCTLLTNIGTYAFYDLYLENLIINSYDGCTIGDYAFYNCNFIGTGGLSGFNTLNLGGVVSIGVNAFGMSSNNVNAFTTVSIDSSTVSIGTSAFFNCVSITTLYIATGSQLQSIGDYAFGTDKSEDFQLTYIGTGSGEYPWNSFQNCSQLTYIGQSCFYNGYLRNLIINSSALGGCTINDYAFYNCNFIGTGGDGFPSGFNTLQLDGVVSIGENAFGISNNNVNAYTSVSLDPTTVSIGTSAFFNCVSIASLVIPTGSQLQTIGDSAFNNNKDNDFGLTYIGTGSGNWNGFQNCFQLNYIGQSAFYNSWLQEINLPINTIDNLSLTVDVSAFYNNNYATTINIGSASVLTLNAGSFDECTSLTEAILLSNASILNWDTAFSNCNNLNTVYINIPGTVLGSPTGGSNNILISDSGYLKYVFFSSNVTSINNNCIVFDSCVIEDIAFNSNIFSIDSNGNNAGGIDFSITFLDCGDIATISYNCPTIGNLYNTSYVGVIGGLPTGNSITLDFYNVTTIQQSAFYGCVGIQNTTIPSSVGSIGDNAFSECTSLAVVTVNTYIPNFQSVFQTTTSSAVSGNNSITQINFDYVSSNSVPFQACQGFTSLKTVSFNSNVYGIDSSAFYGCTALGTVSLSSSIFSDSLGQYVFSGCTALNSVSIPNSTSFNNIPDYMFSGCSALASINPGFSSLQYVSSFGDGAFSGCGFTGCEMSNSVTSLGISVFQGCVNLEAVTLSTNSNITSIPASAFYGCSALSIVENLFTNSNSNSSIITNLQTSAFYGCTSLGLLNIGTPSSITIVPINIYCSPNLTYVGQYAFSNTALNYINIPGSPSASSDFISGIDENAFSGCTILTSVNIPNLLGINTSGSFVPSILEGVFQNCGFEIVDFTNSSGSIFTQGIQSIGNNSFYDCFNLTSINLCNLLSTNNPYLINYVTYIGVAAFGNCNSLNSVTLFSTVGNMTTTFININNDEQDPFSGCTSLQTSSNPGQILTDFGINQPSPANSYDYVAFYFTQAPFFNTIYLPVIYNSNGSTSGTVTASDSIEQANTITIQAPTNLTKDGFIFDGWTSYFTGQQFTYSYGVFSPSTYTVNEYALLEALWVPPS
jgi:hypothetical protein